MDKMMWNLSINGQNYVKLSINGQNYVELSINGQNDVEFIDKWTK